MGTDQCWEIRLVKIKLFLVNTLKDQEIMKLCFLIARRWVGNCDDSDWIDYSRIWRWNMYQIHISQVNVYVCALIYVYRCEEIRWMSIGNTIFKAIRVSKWIHAQDHLARFFGTSLDIFVFQLEGDSIYEHLLLYSNFIPMTLNWLYSKSNQINKMFLMF